tara:strand:+ start:301 stop:1320 length:1020 start_codon:yes stop_codon:yes gene_type:complete
MNNFFSSKNKIFTCDVTNLSNNFHELAIESYNKYGVFFITGVYTSSQINQLRNELDVIFNESGEPRGLQIQNIIDNNSKNKLYKAIMHPSIMNVLNSIFSNSDVSLLPPYQAVKNFLPHSSNGDGWHRDCGGQLTINECRQNLSSKKFIFGKMGLFLQDNSEYGGSISIIPGTNRDYFGLLKSWRPAKFLIFLSTFLQKFSPSFYKIIIKTNIINYLLGGIKTKVKAGDIVIFDYRLWHQGTPASPEIEKNLVYNFETLQAKLPPEKTKYVLYSQFGNSLGIKSYFIDRLNRKGNSSEIDSWIDEAASLDKSEINIHEFVKRDSLLDGSFKDLFGLSEQ